MSAPEPTDYRKRKMASLQSIKKNSCIAVFALSALFTASRVFAQTAAPIDTAIATATQWAKLADANQADRMWSSSGPVMQKNVSKEAWIKYLAAVQNELGTVNGRAWTQIVHITNPANLPLGEYVNVVFSSRFSKAPTIEKISLVQVADRWFPVGYVITKVESSPAPAASPAK